ncbi:hypothetical protein C8R44DRAFT_734905 [Mycena epipterygia]|nr:hypothetical protein C8R44DRAFT_734905 [Mycena epipterygia]
MASQVALEDPAESRGPTNPQIEDSQPRPEPSAPNARCIVATAETPDAMEDPTNPQDLQDTPQSTADDLGRDMSDSESEDEHDPFNFVNSWGDQPSDSVLWALVQRRADCDAERRRVVAAAETPGPKEDPRNPRNPQDTPQSTSACDEREDDDFRDGKSDDDDTLKIMQMEETLHRHDPSAATENPTTEPILLKPHPCTLPPPESALVKGITCTTRAFLVDILPAHYPYLSQYSNSTTTSKFQIPFFCFSGPDPPPADIGGLGDVYVAPAASALYAYLADGTPGGGGGAWMRWTAVGFLTSSRLLKLGDPGLLGHPYFPEHLLWTGERKFAWYALSSVHNMRRDARVQGLFKHNEDAEAGAKILVARTLENEKECEEKGIRKRRGEEPERKGPKKKTRLGSSPDDAQSGRTVVPRATSSASQEGPSRNEWDAFYAKPKPNATRATKQLKDQAATIERLEAENEALRAQVEELRQQTPTHALKNQAAAIERMEAENQALRVQVEHIPPPAPAQIAPARMPFHPEFLDFMKETFACEVMLACNAHLGTERIDAEKAAVEAKAQIAALQVRLDDVMEVDTGGRVAQRLTGAATGSQGAAGLETDKTRIAELEAACAHAAVLKAAKTRIAALELEIECGKNAAATDASSLKLASDYLTEARRKIAGLEAEINRSASKLVLRSRFMIQS